MLVLATVVPFMALDGAGLGSHWRVDRAAAVARARNEARLLAAQLDDHISNLENLLAGLSAAVSTNPADTGANDALLRQIKTKLPNFAANILLFSLDGSNIGTSSTPRLAVLMRATARFSNRYWRTSGSRSARSSAPT